MNNLVEIKNVRGYVSEEGVAFLNLEDVARGLGFIQMKNGKEYVRWETIKRYLSDLSYFPSSWENNFIPENVFYKLCMKANNDVARAFQDLVCDEILPSIRKNGGYMVAKENETDEEILSRALLIAQKAIEKRDIRISELEKKIEDDAPMVEFAESVMGSIDSITIGQLAVLLNQGGYETGEKRLFKWMRENGYLVKAHNSNRNLPKQKWVDKKLFEVEIRSRFESDGTIRTSPTTKVTPIGQKYFIELFKNM